jgi:hypothetical protein
LSFTLKQGDFNKFKQERLHESRLKHESLSELHTLISYLTKNTVVLYYEDLLVILEIITVLISTQNLTALFRYDIEVFKR